MHHTTNLVAFRRACQPFSTGNFYLQRENPKGVKQMVLKLIFSDSECSDVPLEVAFTHKLDTAKNNTAQECSHERESKMKVSNKLL